MRGPPPPADFGWFARLRWRIGNVLVRAALRLDEREARRTLEDDA